MLDKATKYARIKYALAITDVIYMLFLLGLFQSLGIASWLRAGLNQLFINQFFLIFFYCLTVIVLYFILSFPIDLYRSYIVEHKFGLSVEKFFAWLFDHIKAGIVGVIIFLISIEGFFYFLRSFPDNWWWQASLFWIFLSIVLARLFPILIIPLFFKYKRIDNEDLRNRILNLANEMNIKILDVFSIDFSKKTTKANAGLVGLGKSKRVILTDTLEGKFSSQEIEVILAHEFAHYRLRHLIKLIILNAVVVLFTFYILFKICPVIFGKFNLALSDIAGLSIWIFCFAFFQVSLTPFTNWISRNMERNADRLAIESTGQRGAFISMIEKLAQQNLAEQKPPLWAKIFFYDHPPIEERVALAKKEK